MAASAAAATAVDSVPSGVNAVGSSKGEDVTAAAAEDAVKRADEAAAV